MDIRRGLPLNCLLVAGALMAVTFVYAQEVDMAERSRRMMDQAMQQAKTLQSNELRRLPKSGIDLKALRKKQPVDPIALAEKYRKAGAGRYESDQALKVFISMSMPKKALKMLGEQAYATGAILVLRGMKGRLGEPGVLQNTIEAMEEVSSTGADVQIDPEEFTRHSITAVPSFVISGKDEDCGTDQCATRSSVLTGDVTLEYALEQWIKRGGATAVQAEMYLKRLERGRHGDK